MWDYVLFCEQLRKGDWFPVECMFGWVCACKWQMSGEGKWGLVLPYNSFCGSWLSALWTLVRDVQGERFISQKIQEIHSNWKITSNLTHSRLFFHWLKNKKEKRKKNINPTSYFKSLLEWAAVGTSIVFCFFSQLELWWLLRPLIRRASLQSHTGSKMSLEQRGESLPH